MPAHLRQLTRIQLATIAAVLAATIAFAYYQYQAYETERKLDIERKEISQRIREQGRMLAEQMRKNPLRLPQDPLAPESSSLASTPSDAEEMVQIKLWHQTPPEQRKKLAPDSDKSPSSTQIEELTQPSDAANVEEEAPDAIAEQTLLTVQRQALAAQKQRKATNK